VLQVHPGAFPVPGGSCTCIFSAVGTVHVPCPCNLKKIVPCPWSPNKIPDTTKKDEGRSNSTSAPGQSLDQGEQEMGIR